MEIQGIFSVNRPDIVHETIEGETVIVNLENGIYYSLRGSGVDVWNLIETGANFDELLDHLIGRYDDPEEEIEISLIDLLMVLQKEGLVNVSSSKPNKKKQVPIQAGGEKIKFTPPELEKYSDLKELLLLDPIHEVDEEGWPNKVEEKEAGNSE